MASNVTFLAIGGIIIGIFLVRKGDGFTPGASNVVSLGDPLVNIVAS